MIILYMAISSACAFGIVGLLEFGWANRPLSTLREWPKARAIRFIWAGIGILVVIGSIPLGILAFIAGLPIGLAHIRLVDRDPLSYIRPKVVAEYVYETGRNSFRRFVNNTRIRPN